MKPGKEQISKIEEAFQAVYGKETFVSVSPAWEDEVMRAVRRAPRQPARKPYDADALGHLVWRFAMASCLVLLVLMTYAVAGDPGGTSEIARLFFEDPLVIDVVHTLEAV